MPKFKIRLESQTDDQSREVTLTASSKQEAIKRAERKERSLVAFSLLPAEPVAPEAPGKTALDSEWEDYERLLAAHENALAAYPAELEAAKAEVAELDEQMLCDARGKIVAGPKGRTRAHWHAHHQAKPYKVASVEEVRLSDAQVERLGRELATLHGQDEGAWDRLLADLKAKGIPLAAVTGFMYGVPVKNQYDGTAVVDWDTDTIKVMLLTGHTENQDTHDFVNDVVANEVSGTGYTADGATLGSKAITYDTASDQVRMDAADTTWTTSTISATEAVVYKDTGTDATSPLIGYIDFGATVSTTAGTFQITWDATGIIIIDVT
jgi:hypothetical protein